MGRFEDGDEDMVDLLREVTAEYFPEFRNVRVKCLFDMKKRMSGGKVVLGRIQKCNDLLKHLTAEEAQTEEGFDCILYVDNKAWTNIGREDRIRILRHELRHLDFNAKGDLVVVPHDLEDFVEEVALNQDDVAWSRRVATLTSDIYEQEKEQAEGRTTQRRGGRRGR